MPKSMNKYVRRYFQEAREDSDRGHFHRVIAVNQNVPWEVVQREAKETPRGWYELSQLDAESRGEFTRQFWSMQLADAPLVEDFFDKVEDIFLFLVQQRAGDSFEPHLVYSLKGEAGFYQGTPPLSERELDNHSFFQDEPLPADYMAFQHIHAQFGKNGDSGIYNAKQIKEGWELLQKFLSTREPLLFYNGQEVDSKKLIPFYNSYGRYSWQCFCEQWRPEEEMGNALVSYETVFLPMLRSDSAEGLAFPTFFEWLAFYLEAPLEV